MKHSFAWPAVAGVLGLLGTACAQVGIRPDQPDMKVSETQRATLIQSLLRHLNEGYVFPDIARKMEAAVRDRESKGEYRTIESAKELARKLTQDLQAVCKDKHLRVMYSHEPIPSSPSAPTTEQQKRRSHFARVSNNGFEKVEKLAGNVGYIKFNGFASPDQGAETVAAAMSFVANTDALILDLRQNGGGSAEMVAFICSYFFPASERVHLNSIYFRKEDRTEQFHTLPLVSGKRYLDKPVYVLTSNYTFSAAEEFSYNLQTQKRATIVGETTGGGAHPVQFVPVATNFAVSVPFARSINPITKTNWEGTGVKPEIAVPAADALRAAHVHALKKQIAKTEDADVKAELQRVLETVEKGEGKP